MYGGTALAWAIGHFCGQSQLFLRQTGDELKTEQRVADLGGGPRPTRREFPPLFTFPRHLLTQTRAHSDEPSESEEGANFRGRAALTDERMTSSLARSPPLSPVLSSKSKSKKLPVLFCGFPRLVLVLVLGTAPYPTHIDEP